VVYRGNHGAFGLQCPLRQRPFAASKLRQALAVPWESPSKRSKFKGKHLDLNDNSKEPMKTKQNNNET
jgi:hypothetical protein